MRQKPIPPHVLEQIFSDKVQSRFWSYVTIGNYDECWDWNGSKSKADGYGQFGIYPMEKVVVLKSHKFAWVSANLRDVCSGLYVLHECNRKQCCNPNHLKEGTQLENLDDSVRAHSIHTMKLSEFDVIEILSLYWGGMKMQEIADRFSVSDVNVSSIVSGKTWKHITG